MATAVSPLAPPAFPELPPIAGSPVATGEPGPHIDQVLNGKPGTAMAPYRDVLNDADMAAVLTYQRNAWGNDAGVIQPAAVKAAR